MKKLLLSTLLFTCSLAAFAQFKIAGRVASATNIEILLVKNGENGLETIGKTKVTNGVFTFEGNVETLTIAHIMTTDKTGIYATFMLEDGNYQIGQTVDGWVVMGGGETQKVWQEFDKLNKEAIKVTKKFQKDVQNATSEKQILDMRSNVQEFLLSLQINEIELLKKHNNTLPAAYVVSQYMMSLDEPQLKERFGLLGNNAKASFIGKKIAARLAHIQKFAVGITAPNFSGSLSDGGVITLHEANAKVKLVTFWASENEKSRQENVNLLQLYKRFRPKGLEIISVSLDTNKQFWLNAIGQDGNTWRNILDVNEDSTSISELYCVLSLPTTYLLDEENRIVAINLHGKELEKKIDEILKKNK